MKTFVKFCGLTEPTAVAQAPEGGAAGFVIEVPASPRSLTVAQAIELVGQVPPGAEAWAVVVDPSTELVRRIFDDIGVDRIQVHGRIPEGLDFLEIHHLVPSLPVPLTPDAGPVPELPPAESYPRVHLDAAGGPLPGGSGQRPDWEMCHTLVQKAPGRKLILAGGLTPENVGDALTTVGPWGVDVSSGVEQSPGVKDLARMRAFLSAVEAWEKSHA
ncbi:MAG: phosphoribosylanthranilate isomerase [Thermoplasmata archaeon]|nr:phosphoribosylanthranilate isomerase [Thermoplasmata archaeon]